MRATISSGVLGGANTPSQLVESTGRPLSISVGHDVGRNGGRSLPVSAKTLTLPASMSAG
jgi:Tfp pilus assembly protein PilP